MVKSEEQFIEMLRGNQGILKKVANSYCKNFDDRDDLIQEITIQLWKSWTKYNDQYKLSTWIYKISLNVAISFYRKKYRHNFIVQHIDEDVFFLEEVEDHSLSENIKKLYRHIGQLDELNKALILLYLDEMNHEEIAATLGISKSNVATKISRIKKQLQKKFNIK